MLPVAGLATVAFVGSCSPADGDAGPAGLWSGPIAHNGQESVFAIRLEDRGDDSLAAYVSMPAMGAYDVFVGVGLHDGSAVRIGGWSGRLDPAGTFTGTVPSALLPAYEVSFQMRRVDELPGPELEVADALLVDPVWIAELAEPVWAGITVAEGLVFAATDGGMVAAMPEGDGAVAWTTSVGGAVRATPTVDGPNLYVHSDDGVVTKMDAASGIVIWTTAVGSPANRIPPGEAGSQYDSYGAAVLVANGAAYVGLHEGGVVALDAVSGEELWRVVEQSSVLGSPTTDGERLFYTTFGGDVVAVDARGGEPLWRVSTNGAVVSAATVAGDRLIVGNRAYDVVGVNVEDGSIEWTYYYWFSWVESTARVRDGVAYIGSSDGQRLQALDAGTGEPLWAFGTGGSTWATPAVTAEAVFVGTVGVADYMVAHEARFHAVDRATGMPRWRFDMTPPPDVGTWGFASSPAVGESGVYVGGLDGRVYAFPLGP
jgi:outer membrane protein assembly factor BamB